MINLVFRHKILIKNKKKEKKIFCKLQQEKMIFNNRLIQ